MYLEERMLLLERRVTMLEGRPPIEHQPEADPHSRMSEIVRLVSNQMGVPPDMIRSKDRHAEVVWSRQMVHALAFEFLGMTQCCLARLCGVDHGTVHYSRAVVSERCETNNVDRETMEKLRAAIKETQV